MTALETLNPSFNNYELALNPSFPTASASLACSKCNYVAKFDELDDTVQTPCPKCGFRGVARFPFPDTSAMELLKMVAYFYAKAKGRVDDLQIKFLNEVRAKIGRTCDWQEAITAVKEINDLYNKRGGKQEEFEQMLEIIKKRLSLVSLEESKQVFPVLATCSKTFEEHKAVVILTSTLLEKLFRDLMVVILTVKGMTEPDAREKLDDKWQNFERRCKEFEKKASVSLEDAIGQCSIPKFFSDWMIVREKRNYFLHGNPYAIGIGTAETAFNLAKNSFSVFAFLQNRFGLLKLTTSPPA